MPWEAEEELYTGARALIEALRDSSTTKMNPRKIFEYILLLAKINPDESSSSENNLTT